MVHASTPDTESGVVVGLAPDLIGTVRTFVVDNLGVVGKVGALGRIGTGRLVPAPSIQNTQLLAIYSYNREGA